MKFKKYLLIIVIGALFSILYFGCIPDFFENDFGKVAGIVTNANNDALSGVKVQTGDVIVYSDGKGKFNFDKISIGTNIVLNFSKDGYSSTQKVVKTELNKTTFSYAALRKWDKSETIDLTKENIIIFQNANVKLPANSIVDDKGKAFAGSVIVNVSYYDPESVNYDKEFPGDFKGENSSGQEVAIESYGFINVELNAGDKMLNLASGKLAEITIPVPENYKANAPDPISLWYFDKEEGIWREEGTASIQNGKYVGNVSHFSSWNCDIGFPIARLKGKVICKNGTPIKNAIVKVKGFGSAWSNSERTKDDGSYIIDVKADAIANIYAYKTSNTGEIEIDKRSQNVHINTSKTGDTKLIEDLIIECDTANPMHSTLYDINLDLLFVPIAVGEFGKIIYYDLNSDVWIPISAGTTQDFYSIAISESDNIWIVGSNGSVKNISIADNIEQVISVPIGTDANLYNIEFYNGYYGWIMGTTGKIFSTSDGGNNWSIQSSGIVQTLYDASFYSKDKGWICGANGTVLHTEDGGNTWNAQISGTVEDLKGICFIDDENGWSVGNNGKIIRTFDGGQSWTNQNIAGVFENFKDIDFGHPNGGIIVGDNGTIFKTIDGGNTWTNESVVLKNNLEAVDIDQFGNGIVVGDDNLLNVKVGEYPFSKGWNIQNSNVTDTLRCVKAVSVNEAWVVGDSGIVLHTTDSGNTWAKVLTNDINDYYSLEISGNTIWIGGENSNLMKSVDYGGTWQKQPIVPTGKIISKIQFLDQYNGWILLKDKINDKSNIVLKTNDGAANWSNYNSLPGGAENYYSDFYFTDKNRGYVIDFDDSKQELLLYSTGDAGNNWIITEFENLASSEGAIASLNDNLFWVGSEGEFYMYHNESGKKWYSILAVPLTSYYYGNKKIEFLSPQTGYAGSGGIKKTTDGGKSWFTQGTISGFIDDVNSFDMVNVDTGWAVGGNGKIYYTTTGGE